MNFISPPSQMLRSRNRTSPSFQLPPGASPVSRRDALRLFSAAVCGTVLPAVAQDTINNNPPRKPKKGERGTKEAKGYQLCLSQCLYDCTTPKTGLAKERSECRVECKDECAISRDQL